MRLILICQSALMIALAAVAPAFAAAKPSPNFLVIVADDLGWNDVAYHNSEIRTPNIDRMAQAGIELDCHYVQPQCTPTRVALLTGRYPGRFGPHALAASNARAIPPGTLTMASMLKSVGYSTGLVGKWHLGSRPEWAPNHYGFDSSYGSLAGAIGMYDHRYRLNTPFAETWHRDGKIIPGYENGVHATDLVANEAVRWIEEREEHEGEPWFLYVPFQAPHAPIVERDERWHALNEHIESEDRRLYAAAVSHMDGAIGQIVEALERTEQRDETLVLFTSDNGAQVNHAGNIYPAPDPKLRGFSSNAPLRGKKSQLYEGGYRVPAFVAWPGRIGPRRVSAPMHIVDWMPTLATLVGYQATENPEWDGQNVWPMLSGEQDSIGERTFYWTWHPDRTWEALRHGDWKIVRRQGKDWELYNLHDDPSEKQNLAGAKPEKVEELFERFQRQRASDVD